MVYHIRYFVPEEIDSFRGLHCLKTRTIYLRLLEDDAEMRGILVHEMTHAAIGGAHDDRFWGRCGGCMRKVRQSEEHDFRLAALGRKQISDEQLQDAA